MDSAKIASEIIALKTADLDLRDELLKKGQLYDGYHPKMEQLHLENAERLAAIVNTFGFPSTDRVGEEACAAAWLVIQHAISKPSFMRSCAAIMANEVANGSIHPRYLAYLNDRIAIFEGRLQKYGTQFDWDEKGEMSPSPYDDLKKVDKRRKAIGLNSLAAQTDIMRAQVGNESPPSDLIQRQQVYDAWRKRVGWI